MQAEIEQHKNSNTIFPSRMPYLNLYGHPSQQCKYGQLTGIKGQYKYNMQQQQQQQQYCSQPTNTKWLSNTPLTTVVMWEPINWTSIQ